MKKSIKKIMEKEISRMCNLLAAVLFLLTVNMTSAFAENSAESDLLIYISPKEYSHEVRVGYLPYFSVWVRRGPMLEKAAREALKPLFKGLGLCAGNNTADVIIWLKPQLAYNPIGGYHATVKAQFHLGNGKYLGTLKATGKRYGQMNSGQVDNQIQQAYGKAMQDIARQYTADSTLREAIRSGLAKDITKAPCAMMTMIPNP